MSVISIAPAEGCEGSAASLVAELSERLALEPRRGEDGTWEFPLSVPYSAAHATVVDALNHVDPRWPARVTLEYALTI
jgi:hypothetical protein